MKSAKKWVPKVSSNFEAAPKNAKGKKATVPASIASVMEPNGAPSDNKDGAPSEESSSKKRKTRKEMRRAVKAKKAKKVKLIKARMRMISSSTTVLRRRMGMISSLKTVPRRRSRQ